MIALALLAGGVPTACGGSDSSEPADKPDAQNTAPAKPKGDPHPRVEGRWRVVYTPRDPDAEPGRTTWSITPTCEAGACSFRAKSTHVAYRFRFDAAIGDYTARTKYTQDCFNLTTDEVLVKDAYKARSQITVEVIDAVKTDEGVAYATEMSGVCATGSNCPPRVPLRESAKVPARR